MIGYPKLKINLTKIKENAKMLQQLAGTFGIEITGVVKGTDSFPQVARAMIEGGLHSIADSRIEAIQQLRQAGIQEELWLLRLPMLSEVGKVVAWADVSLNSEMEVLEALNQQAQTQNKIHKVVLMADLGDLREGYMEQSQLMAAALQVEKELPNLKLYGIGTNLGCYGSIKPDIYNLGQLVEMARTIEKEIGRSLDIVSGGASTSIPLLVDGVMPSGINHLRAGEGILLSMDLPNVWGYPMEGFHQDAYVLEAEVIEVKDKPSHPIGEIFVDAFGGRPEYEDIGIRKRALLAVGKKDMGHHDSLKPLDDRVQVIGSSSDHLIVDVTDLPEVKVGDILSFTTFYQAMLFAASSTSVNKEFIS